jgi:glycosyltransferase involved in cell wall biosynthesis
MELRTSVVICASSTERWVHLQRAVASVGNQTLPAFETVVIVDNNAELLSLATAELSGAVVMANTNVPGLSGARQTGVEHTAGEIIAFLDDDAIADPQWLAEMAPAYGDPNVLGGGGLVEPIWADRAPLWLPREFYWVVGCTYDGMPVSNGQMRNPIGANMSMRRTVMDRTGTFEPLLGRLERNGRPVSGTADETEYCIRASELHPGGYWAYRPLSRVGHVVPVQRATWRYFVKRCRLEGSAKATITQLRGSDSGLSSERGYVQTVLPRAVLRELRAALSRRPGALASAVTIVVGLAITVYGYVEAKARALMGRR